MCLVELLSRLSITKKKSAMCDQKPPFVFDNHPLLRLFKVPITSPLINSCSTQKPKRLRVTMFIVFMFFSAHPHLYVRLHSLWVYTTAHVKICDHLQYKLAQDNHVFSSQKNKSCTWSICADICTGMSGDFPPIFKSYYNI